MEQWTNLKKFGNQCDCTSIYGKSGGLHLAEPGFTAGRQADKIWVGYDILEACCDRNLEFSALFNQDTASF